MKRIIRLTERDLTRIVKRVIQEEADMKEMMTKDDQIKHIINVDTVNPKIIGSDATIEWNNASGASVQRSKDGGVIYVFKHQPYSFDDGEEIVVDIEGCAVTPGAVKPNQYGVETNHLVNCLDLGGNYELADDAKDQPLKVIYKNSEIKKDDDSDVA